jgi:hypothetical protein
MNDVNAAVRGAVRSDATAPWPRRVGRRGRCVNGVVNAP